MGMIFQTTIRAFLAAVSPSSAAFVALLGAAPASAASAPSPCGDLPQGFEQAVALDELASPASFDFMPDGRMLFSERINGHLRVAAEVPAGSGQWVVSPEAYATFDVPRTAGVPAAHRSSGVRGFAFDPDFAANGYVYVFYMKNNPRHNRVVRIRQDPTDPSRALPGETLLIDLPFNGSTSSGSHNGGALRFGEDGLLYITTGDGWSGGDSVQSLSTFTGKVLRIRGDGSIPQDNPFFTQASGAYRAIYALGLRNPYTLTRDPASGLMLIGEANGADKADVLRLEAGANYRHQGFGGIGTSRGRWANGAGAGNKMISGGAWYPLGGPFPPEYHGAYFMALWGINGSNGGPPGQLSFLRSAGNPTAALFAANVGQFDGAGTRLKPVHLRIGPDGALYYCLTSYMTGAGQIVRVSYTGGTSIATPKFLPDGGSFPGSVPVRIGTSTPGATVRYTLDGSIPSPASPAVRGPVPVDATGTLRARAFLGAQASALASADFVVGTSPNLPPITNAGPDQVATLGQIIVLNGAATTDPDGSDLNLSETWTQIGGPPGRLSNADETAAYFFPSAEGTYRFRLSVSDGFDVTEDETLVHVQPCVNDITDSLVARWSFEEQAGAIALDSNAGLWNGTLEGPEWSPEGAPGRGGALQFDGSSAALQVGTPDVSGTEITITAWIFPDDFDVQDARILSKATGPQESDHLWMLSTIRSGSSHHIRARLCINGQTRTVIGTGPPVETGRWTFVSLTYDGGRLRLYQNLIPVAELVQTGELATNPSVPAAIGNQPEGSRPFDGRIDEVRVYSRALSHRELAVVSGRARNPNCPPTAPANR